MDDLAHGVGLRIDGVTVLRMDDHGQFTAVSIHHRPLAAVLAFSAEMGRRLARSLPYARSTASWAASRTGERPGSEIR